MNHPKKATAAVAISLALGLFLTACDSADQTTKAEGAADQAKPKADEAAAVKVAPLKLDQLKIGLSQVGEPVYDAAADSLRMTFRVTNSGTETFISKGDKPVRVGWNKIPADSAGITLDKDSLGTGRGSLAADLVPGASADATVVIPASEAIGGKLQVEVMQEMVSWFGMLNQQPTVIVGPFERCAGQAQSLCLNGVSLASNAAAVAPAAIAGDAAPAEDVAPAADTK